MPVTKTFTVKNVGGSQLVLGAITIPPGAAFTATAPTDSTLDPNETATFTVTYTAASTATSTVSLATNDPTGGENPFVLNVKGQVYQASVILDNNTPGFTVSPTGTGTWVTGGNQLQLLPQHAPVPGAGQLHEDRELDVHQRRGGPIQHRLDVGRAQQPREQRLVHDPGERGGGGPGGAGQSAAGPQCDSRRAGSSARPATTR